MLRDKAVTLLRVRPDEIRMVTLVAALFLCIQAGQGFGENAAFALFLSSIKVDVLPYMYMGLGGVVFLASVAYSASLTRFQNSRVVINLLAGAFLLFAVEWVVIVLAGNSFSYPVLWLTTYGMSVVLGTMLWTVAGEVCDARQAKRLFPLFTSMGILGSVLGNSLTGVVANFAGANSLIVLYAILLAAGVSLARVIAKDYFVPETLTNIRFSMVNDIRAGYDFVRGSGLFRLVAISSILYSILFFTVDFPFSERLSDFYQNDAAGLAGFKGTFTSITTAVTFLVSLLLANRLYTKLGIVNSVLIMPITYVVAFVIFFSSFNIWGAMGARFSQLVVLGGLMGTAWNALFNVVPPDRRGQVLAFSNGVPAQVGVVLSGLLIVLSNSVLTDAKVVLLLGAFVALISVYVTIKMRPAYGEALLSALRAGRAEVFNDEDDAFAGYQNDPAVLQVILKALSDQKAYTRRLAVEMLARMRETLAIPDLVERLHDDDASVRAAATQALADLGARSVFGEIILGLGDSDDIVRERTLASLPKLEVASSPELIRTLERLLGDPNITVRAHAAVVLIYLGEHKRAQAFLSKLLKDKDVNKREIALDSLGHIADSAHGELSFKVDFIFDALDDPAPVIRREAIRVISLLNGLTDYEPIVDRLSDEDATVRSIASETLKQAWPKSRAGVIRILEGTDDVSLDSALDSIPPGDVEILDILRGYIQRETTNIHYLRTLIRSFPSTGRAVSLLIETLKHRDSLSEQRLVKAVGLFGNRQAMELVRKSLNAGDAGTRAAALETLETVGDKRITNEVLPILDRGGVFVGGDDQRMDVADVVDIFLRDENPWFRALATYVVAELQLSIYVPVLRRLLSDPIPLVKDAANNAIGRMDGTVIMKRVKNVSTLRTLSTLDRILLLREIPMFSKLSPEDLERIAEIAQEQLYSSHSLICREGDPGSTLFIIVNGEVDVIKLLGKKQNILATRRDGEFVGEMAILESAPRSATLKARGDVRALTIEGDAFKTILHDRPEVAVSVLRHMSSRVRELNEMVGVQLAVASE
jgi:HEAT repeat protein/ATP/ADP translocase